MDPRRLLVAVGFASIGATGCAKPPPVSHLEDRARLDVPIAICRKALAPANVNDAGAPNPDAYVSVVFPSFHGMGAAISAGDPDCVGEALGPGASGSDLTPKPIASGDVIVASGEEEIQAVWLPAFRDRERAAAGPLALMRPRASELDVYALGVYQGSAAHSRFVLGRLESAQVVIASDDRCAEVKVDVECESRLTFYLAAGGELRAAAETPMTRVRSGTLKNVGRVQYRLTTDPPVLDKSSIRVHERLEVRDAGGEDVHRAEGDRTFALQPDGRLVAQQDTLWSQVPKVPKVP